MKTPLTIYYCGYEACKSGHFFGPAVRPHYLIHFILSGKGSYEVESQQKSGNKKVFEVSSGEAFLIKPGEVTFYRADISEPWEYVWIAFDGEEAERMINECQMGGQQYIVRWVNKELGVTEEIEGYIRKIGKIFEQGTYKQDELRGYFYLIFSQMAADKSENNQPYDKSYVEKAVSYMRHNYSYDIHIDEVACFVGIERTYLYKIFMKYKGISPKQYLTAYRMLVAKDMLVSTKLSVTEIALSCGFNHSSVFCKRFILQEGISPLQYRKALHQGAK